MRARWSQPATLDTDRERYTMDFGLAVFVISFIISFVAVVVDDARPSKFWNRLLWVCAGAIVGLITYWLAVVMVERA